MSGYFQRASRGVGPIGPTVSDQLESAGWHLDQATEGGFLASHSEIDSVPDARQRLQQMGLLTSSQVRIEFLFAPPKPRKH